MKNNMNSTQAIKALEEYIKSLSGKSKIYSKMNKEMNT
jgi:hypothetical protein